MIISSDTFYGIIAVISFFVIIFVTCASAKNEKQRRHNLSINFEITGDAKIAVDTLVRFGYSKEESEELVRAAVGKAPEGDYKTLINVALKQQ